MEGSSCNERKLSFRTLIGLRVLTSRRISVLSMKFGRFPPIAGLWYEEEEEEEYGEESTNCTTKAAKDASHKEDHWNPQGEDWDILVCRSGRNQYA